MRGIKCRPAASPGIFLQNRAMDLAFPAMSFHFPFLFSSILSPLAARSAVVAMGTIPRIIPSLPVIQPAAQSQARVIATTPWPLVTGTQSQQGPAQVAQPPMAVANQTMALTATLLGGSVTASSTSVQSSASVPTALAGLLMGDGLAPLLVKRIVQLEFVEMADLLPEAWLLE